MNTKEKIINEAIRVYNREGVRTVTTRQIAQEMGISAGNLHYHFKHTEDIIFHVFQLLQTEYDKMILLPADPTLSFLQLLNGFVDVSYALIDKYRFIFENFVEICSWIPEIAESYRGLVARREEQLMSLFMCYADAGMFRRDIPLSNLKSFVRQLFIVSDFWSSSYAVLGRPQGIDPLDDYRQTIYTAFYPYLL
ncbi:TetR/AcrR family transcriptional regulator [Sphingobacterium multivorum]|uniref:TetR/AcrR family transcriptional regulator n=1 Tax=Sphingobacterium multivorum TaxID=28454 RepID=UPI00289F96A2|nr:TetR/AcrR family transcriptional regulator [Sphingobacterium multivorum]